MRFAVGARFQTALVILLFLGSLAALFISGATAFLLPGEEFRVRGTASQAAARMAQESESLLDESWPKRPDAPLPSSRKLSALSEKLLAGQPGMEGGFYLAGDVDQFIGAFLQFDPHHPPPGTPPPRGEREPPPPRGDRDSQLPRGQREPPSRPPDREPPPSGREPPPGPPPRHDPPPMETPYIRQQARDSLERDPAAGPLIQTLDVGPGRVVVATAPIGTQRPARAAAWVMIRLAGPEQQQAQLLRTQISTGLALAGILLALLLTANLAWTLRGERQRRDRLVDELRRSEHLASLGKLLAGVAHEVRNPLAGIRSTVQLWQRLPDQAQTPASLDAVLHAVDRLNALVGRLLYFARSGWEEPRPIDLNAVVRETVELVRAQAEGQGVHLEAKLAVELPPLVGSPQALQQVVLNLATNALQAMPNGGQLSFHTRSLNDPKRAELRVADSGQGVSAEARPHLFEPFYTTRAEGTGLGLALCREIVRQHRGDIDLQDGDAPGAVFRVWLPAQGLGERPA
jgi:two-component system, NtrC family, sensor histidine kinase HydH